MTPLKALASAAALAVGLFVVCDTASAGGRYRGGGYHGGGYYGGGYRGGYRGPAVSVGIWGPGYWGGGWGRGYYGAGWGWGGGYWGAGYGGWGPGWGYWGAPVYASAPIVMVQEPNVWVESEQAAATTPLPAPQAPSTNPNTQQWWYWCASTRGYYPYVSNCAEGWQRVAPQPVPAAK